MSKSNASNKKATQKRAGRPLRGDQKRLRVSFTLHPRHIQWLRKFSADRCVSSSEALDQVFDLVQKGQAFSKNEKQFILERVNSLLKKKISLSEIEQICRTFCIRKLSLFGSILTSQFGPNSDIDLLVEFDSGQMVDLFDLSQLEIELRKVFGNRKIDLKTEKELSRYFRDDVMNAAEVLYAA